MIITIIILSLLLVASLVYNVVGTFAIMQNFELNDKFEEAGEQVDQSLDIIDDCYQRIVKASEIPVMSDEPVIKELLNDIKHTKHAILLIANKLVTFDEEETK